MTRAGVLPRVALAVLAALVPALAGCGGGGHGEAPDTAETVIGERLFRETRFAESFARRVEGRRLLDPRPGSDPALDETETTDAPLPGPYAGHAMNCAACHLVDEQAGVAGGGMRAYADFAARSPVPEREDGRTRAPRNAPTLVNASLPRDGATHLHFDGEFSTLEDLVAGTLTGRNYGWLAGERALAVAHVARVVREDDGSDDNAADHDGRPYAVTFRAPGDLLPAALLLRPEFRVDVASASDEQVFDAVVRVVAQYVRELVFAQDAATGAFVGSPYDAFLAKNGLPAAPDPGEAPLDYARRLRGLLAAIPSPREVGVDDGRFAHHTHAFRFGDLERRGLAVFLAEPPPGPPSPEALKVGGAGSCLRCHAPPAFTDFAFHGVGTAQSEFDEVHGDGAFAALEVPGLAARSADPEAFLPPSEAFPLGLGPFLDVPRADAPGLTDLGLWNVFANPAVPASQTGLRATVLAATGLPAGTSDDDLLPRTIAWFKTPGLRDLGHSAPYFHGGTHRTLEGVVAHYRTSSDLQRAGLLRNGAPELESVVLSAEDVDALAAFLRALDEDYE